VKRSGLVVGLVVLAALGVFAWLELKRDTEQGRLREGNVVFPYGSASVLEFTLVNGEDRVTFRRGSSGWERVAGAEHSDASYATDFIGAWSRVRFLEDVEENPSPDQLKEFGLAPPGLSARATVRQVGQANAPEVTRALELGQPGPLLPSFYARVDGFERVVLVTPDAVDLRDGVGRRVLGLEPVVPEEEEHHGDHAAPGAPAEGTSAP